MRHKLCELRIVYDNIGNVGENISCQEHQVIHKVKQIYITQGLKGLSLTRKTLRYFACFKGAWSRLWSKSYFNVNSASERQI